MTKITVELQWSLTRMDPEVGAAWRAWFERYGIDPNTIPIPSYIDADDEARTITYTRIPNDENGKPIFGYMITETMQLDEPPEPFPGL